MLLYTGHPYDELRNMLRKHSISWSLGVLTVFCPPPLIFLTEAEVFLGFSSVGCLGMVWFNLCLIVI